MMGYSLESPHNIRFMELQKPVLWVLIDSPHRGDSNEYPQHRFLCRTDEKYSSIITKYPPYLFHCPYHISAAGVSSGDRYTL